MKKKTRPPLPPPFLPSSTSSFSFFLSLSITFLMLRTNKRSRKSEKRKQTCNVFFFRKRKKIRYFFFFRFRARGRVAFFFLRFSLARSLACSPFVTPFFSFCIRKNKFCFSSLLFFNPSPDPGTAGWAAP